MRLQEHIIDRFRIFNISQIEEVHLGANTCRACIRTRANTGKLSRRIIYVLVSCQGYSWNRVFSFLLSRVIATNMTHLRQCMRLNRQNWFPQQKCSCDTRVCPVYSAQEAFEDTLQEAWETDHSLRVLFLPLPFPPRSKQSLPPSPLQG